MPDHELVIIGGGPAGCSAAIYAARSRIDTLLLTDDFGGQLLLTDSVENYLGFTHETGPDISDRYEQHVRDYQDDIDIERTHVEQVAQDGDEFRVETGNDTVTAEAVIIACGTEARRLDVPGEEAFNNQGIGYCAVCDGPLYRGEDVAVIGGGYSGTEAALFLADIADTVHLLNHDRELSGEPITLEKIPGQDNIRLVQGVDVTRFEGDDLLEAVVYEDRDTGEETRLEVAGAFVEIGRVPNAEIVDFVEKTEDGKIVTDPHCRTSVDGLYAAGDVADIEEEQAIVAAGDGCKAALDVQRYLQEKH